MANAGTILIFLQLNASPVTDLFRTGLLMRL